MTTVQERQKTISAKKNNVINVQNEIFKRRERRGTTKFLEDLIRKTPTEGNLLNVRGQETETGEFEKKAASLII